MNEGWVYLLGGEAGFLEPPLADAWRTRNGQRSELVNRHAWLNRSGQKCGVLSGQIVCFGGVNLSGNPMDVQTSPGGIQWRALDSPASPPWQAPSPLEIKYDFDIVVTKERGSGRVIHTFGGEVAIRIATDNNWYHGGRSFQ